MKRLSFFLMTALIVAPLLLRGEDAATEERVRKLSAQIMDLTDAKEAQSKKIEELTRAVEALQQQLNKPGPNYASAEDAKTLAEKIQEVDRKRKEDNERIVHELENLTKTLTKKPAPPAAPSAPAASTTAPAVSSGSTKPPADKPPADVYEYEIKSGDNLSVIVAAYKSKNIKVTVEDILKANPGLVPEKMRVGQKILIPAPPQ